MKLVYSEHWMLKRQYRADITDWLIEYVIQNSNQLPDRRWEDVLNAICVVQNGRALKVVYRIIGRDAIKIITAFWLN